jgi:hypothetical protein
MLSQSDKTALYSIPDLLDASPLNDYKKNGMQYVEKCRMYMYWQSLINKHLD